MSYGKLKIELFYRDALFIASLTRTKRVFDFINAICEMRRYLSDHEDASSS